MRKDTFSGAASDSFVVGGDDVDLSGEEGEGEEMSTMLDLADSELVATEGDVGCLERDKLSTL